MSVYRDYSRDWVCTFRADGDPNSFAWCNNSPARLLSNDHAFDAMDVSAQAICPKHEGKFVLQPGRHGRHCPVARGGIKLDPTPWAVVFQLHQLDQRRMAAQGSLRTLEEWRDDTVKKAHEYANDAGLCSAFDDFMEEVGLPARTHEFKVTLNFSGCVYVTVTASDEDDACDKVSREDLIREISSNVSWAVDDWEAPEAEQV